MKTTGTVAANIDEYISAFSPQVQAILKEIRKTVRAALPEATEGISYRMPMFRLAGVVLYFAAFKNHIGVFPPVSGDVELERKLAPYAGEKGNLRFPLSQPMRYDLIEEIVGLRKKQFRAKLPKSGRKRP